MILTTQVLNVFVSKWMVFLKRIQAPECLQLSNNPKDWYEYIGPPAPRNVSRSESLWLLSTTSISKQNLNLTDDSKSFDLSTGIMDM